MNTLIETNPIEVRPTEVGLEARILNGEAALAARDTIVSPGVIQWSWACRKVESAGGRELEPFACSPPPAPGDVALVRVEKPGFHKHITTADNRRLRLYPGVQFIGVFGNRYASDAFEAEVTGTENLHLLTGAGMIGTVKSKFESMAGPTKITLVGYVQGGDGRRLNFKNQLFHPSKTRQLPPNLIYVVGSSMNSGKTTTGALLIRALSEMGLNVAACKLTGSVSNHDPDELCAAAARQVIDFSDHGFPSTYLCSKEELMDLFYTMTAQVAASAPDVVLMEFADGLLQRETTMLLADPELKAACRGVVLTAGGSLSALWATARLVQLGYRVIAVSGKFTSSPLAVREYVENDSQIPVVSSVGTGKALAARVRSFLRNE